MDLRMAKIHPLIGSAFLALGIHAQAQRLDNAEVRITYGELKQLLARCRVCRENGETAGAPATRAAFGAAAVFDGRRSTGHQRQLPHTGVRRQDRARAIDRRRCLARIPKSPKTRCVVSENDSLCFASGKAGTHTLQLRLLPITGEDGFSFTIPPCPSMIFETGDLSAGQSVVLNSRIQGGNARRRSDPPAVQQGRASPHPPAGQPRNPRGPQPAGTFDMDMAASGIGRPRRRRSGLSDHRPRVRRGRLRRGGAAAAAIRRAGHRGDWRRSRFPCEDPWREPRARPCAGLENPRHSRPAVDDILSHAPTDCRVKNGPLRLTSIVLRQSHSSKSSKAACGSTPALLTSTSIRPQSSRTASTSD